jgi:hypothetical protein
LDREDVENLDEILEKENHFARHKFYRNRYNKGPYLTGVGHLLSNIVILLFMLPPVGAVNSYVEPVSIVLIVISATIIAFVYILACTKVIEAIFANFHNKPIAQPIALENPENPLQRF